VYSTAVVSAEPPYPSDYNELHTLRATILLRRSSHCRATGAHLDTEIVVKAVASIPIKKTDSDASRVMFVFRNQTAPPGTPDVCRVAAKAPEGAHIWAPPAEAKGEKRKKKAWTIPANLVVCVSGSLAAVFGAYMYGRVVRVEGWRVPVHVPLREYTHIRPLSLIKVCVPGGSISTSGFTSSVEIWMSDWLNEYEGMAKKMKRMHHCIIVWDLQHWTPLSPSKLFQSPNKQLNPQVGHAWCAPM
jgi:hypothetical protein